MTDPVAPSATPEATSQPPDAADDAVEQAKTPEEIEALWQRRLSAKGREHKAAEDAFRAEIERLQRQLAVGGSRTGEAADGEVEELRRELEQERTGRIVDARRAKYPFLAGIVDDAVLASSSEVSLAKLNSRLEDADVAPVMAPTSPRRTTPAPPKKLEQKSKEELLDDLKRVAPSYQEWLRQQQNG